MSQIIYDLGDGRFMRANRGEGPFAYYMNTIELKNYAKDVSIKIIKGKRPESLSWGGLASDEQKWSIPAIRTSRSETG